MCLSDPATKAVPTQRRCVAVSESIRTKVPDAWLVGGERKEHYLH